MEPFLKGCRVEYCVGKSNYGSCKKTSHKFAKVCCGFCNPLQPTPAEYRTDSKPGIHVSRCEQGDVRFVCTAKDKKAYLTLEAAAEELQAALEAVDKKGFKAVQVAVSHCVSSGLRHATLSLAVPRALVLRGLATSLAVTYLLVCVRAWQTWLKKTARSFSACSRSPVRRQNGSAKTTLLLNVRLRYQRPASLRQKNRRSAKALSLQPDKAIHKLDKGMRPVMKAVIA